MTISDYAVLAGVGVCLAWYATVKVKGTMSGKTTCGCGHDCSATGKPCSEHADNHDCEGEKMREMPPE